MIRSIPLVILASCLASADVWTDSFSIEKVSPPPGVDPQVGGIATTPSGKLAACFHRGEVFIYSPKADSWKQFAAGLHEPLGIVAESDSSFLVMQRPELTRIKDTNGDGCIDTCYETVFDDFGMTRNYHEFAFGLAKDKEGYIYLALGTASNGAGIRGEIRGQWSTIGLERKYMLNGAGWEKYKGRADRMYSQVPYRGWVLKVSPDGSSWQPFAAVFALRKDLGSTKTDVSSLPIIRGTGWERARSSTCEKAISMDILPRWWEEGMDRRSLELPVAELEIANSGHGSVAAGRTCELSPTHDSARRLRKAERADAHRRDEQPHPRAIHS